jgi:hypothetical protein
VRGEFITMGICTNGNYHTLNHKVFVGLVILFEARKGNYDV